MNPTPVSLPFTDRAEAGRRLAERVAELGPRDPVVLALPRGGVTVGAELARRLGADLDVLVVRKIGLPGNPEFGVGALTEDDRVHYDDAALARLRVPRQALAATVESERAELLRRLQRYRGGRPAPRLQGREVVVVDDGLATGGTARAALAMVRRCMPSRLVLAVPVAPLDAMETMRGEADAIVVLCAPENFRAVGEWYRHFDQLSDADVTAALEEARRGGRGAAFESSARTVALPGRGSWSATYHEGAAVRAGAVVALTGGEGHHREELVSALTARGLAALVLQGPQESAHTASPEDAPSGPVAAAVDWMAQAAPGDAAGVGVVAAGTAVAGALEAAAAAADRVGAVVTCGGRLDRCVESLQAVHAPTLLLVEGRDSIAREITEWAAARMHVRQRVQEVASTDRLLVDPSAWREVGEAAAGWLVAELRGDDGPK